MQKFPTILELLIKSLEPLTYLPFDGLPGPFHVRLGAHMYEQRSQNLPLENLPLLIAHKHFVSAQVLLQTGEEDAVAVV